MFRDSKEFCLLDKPVHRIPMEWIQELFKVYKDQPKAMFLFIGELTHDSTLQGNANQINIADEDLVKFLGKLKENGELDNTIVIMMSDHGSRFSALRGKIQGKYEERLPYFGIYFPQRFKDDFPDAYNNFKGNIDKLTSPFDIYESLKDVAEYGGVKDVDIKTMRGISLFNKVP